MTGKSVFLSFSLFFLVGSIAVAQTRPKIEPDVQKANKRPPASAPKPTPTPETTAASTRKPPAAGDAPDDGDVLHVDTNLITIPVKISDRDGRLISGLKKEDFKIFENGVEQEIAYFSNEEQAFTVALVLDMSYSTTFKIAEIQAAARAFITQLRPKDRVMIVSFDEDVHVLCEPTNDRAELLRAIKSTRISNGTSLYEAIDLVINQRLKKISGRKAIVLFTDGVDTTSRRADLVGNEKDASELDALIYPLQYDTYSDVQRMKNAPPTVSVPTTSPIPGSTQNKFPFPIPNATPTTLPFPMPTSTGRRDPGTGPNSRYPDPSDPRGSRSTEPSGLPGTQGTTLEEYRRADQYLAALAQQTGGRVYQATTAINLASAFTNIANELREFYSLGYYPQTEGKIGEKRGIKVRVVQKNVAVQSRDSYVVGQK